MTIAELAAGAGVSVRTVRFYGERGLLPAAVFRARATRYLPEHARVLAAIVKMRAEGVRLDAIKKRLQAMSPEEVERFVAPPSAPSPAAEKSEAPKDMWEVIGLVPGLALFLSANASPHVREAAREIQARFLPSQPKGSAPATA
jgi:DNA-binding transcriptional MerR regulator